MATVSGESKHASNQFSLSDIFSYITYSGTPDVANRTIDLVFHIKAYSQVTAGHTTTGNQTNMAFHVGGSYSGSYNIKINDESIVDYKDYTLNFEWGATKANPPTHYTVDKFGTKVHKKLSYKDDGTLSFKLNYTLTKKGVYGLTTGTTETITFKVSQTITLPSIGANWSAPSTSGFWVSRSPGSVKPDGTITCSCGGLSGGSGNGDYKDYRMYFTVYRGGNKIGTHDLGVTSSTSFVPSSYYHPRVGDSIFVHGVGRTKNSSGSIYDLIDKCYQENSTNTSTRIYKDGIVYIKDTSGVQHEATMAYVKDTSGNKQKLRYIPVKDTSGVQRIIDMYTVYYES